MAKNPRGNFTLKLLSNEPDIEDIEIHGGEVMIIGRKTIPKIKDLKCPSQLFEIEVRAEENNWFTYIKNMVSGETALLKDGQQVEGPGFSFTARHGADSAGSEASANQQSRESPSSNPKKFKARQSPDPPNLESNSPPPPSSGNDDKSSSWDDVVPGSVLLYKYLGGGTPNSKIASFDFDGTIVKVKSGTKFPRDGNDWVLFDKRLPEAINKYKNTHRFVIFSNQMGVSLGSMPVGNIKNRIEKSLARIGIPALAFLALKDDRYRKPSPGMFSLLKKEFNQDIEIKLEESFFVGDAAGRKTAFNRDHS